jgi:aminopeptidase N
VTVAEEPGQISVRQSRFLTTGDVKPEEDETTWWIPLSLKSGAQIKSPGSALTVKEDTIRDVDDSFYKLNADQSGFYRTNYPPARLSHLGQMRERLSTPDRIGLMGDATALAVAGDGTTAGLLTLLENFKDEDDFL